MSAWRKPGPQDSNGCDDAIDSGTMCRHRSPTPGATGSHAHARQIVQPRIHEKLRKSLNPIPEVLVPILRAGSGGSHVELLQRLLNSRLYGSQTLRVDGSFGPKTQESVIRFQENTGLLQDGIVGPKTWFSLVSASIPKAPVPLPNAGTSTPTSVSTPPSLPKAPNTATSLRERTVADWSLEEKFEYVIRATVKYLAPDLRDQFVAMLTPLNIAFMVGTLAIWAAGHFFGASEIADVVLLVVGLGFLGLAAIDVARYLKNCLVLTVTASSTDDLEHAADDLAKAIAIIGVIAFFVLLAKIARSFGKVPKEPVDNTPKAEPETPKRARPQREETKPSSKATPKPVGTIDESKATFSPEERKVAEVLSKEGKDVEAVPRSDERTPDALVDGKPVEFKTMDPGADSATVRNEVNNSIKNGGQARDFILDARDSGLTEAEAQRGLNRVSGITRGKVDSVRIVGDGYDITREY